MQGGILEQDALSPTTLHSSPSTLPPSLVCCNSNVIHLANICAEGWHGYTRSEIRKAVEQALVAQFSSNNPTHSILNSAKPQKQKSTKVCSTSLYSGVIFLVLQETQLKAVINSLDEKLRDLKNKYAEEMRRSLHIQSERIHCRTPFLFFIFLCLCPFFLGCFF